MMKWHLCIRAVIPLMKEADLAIEVHGGWPMKCREPWY